MKTSVRLCRFAVLSLFLVSLLTMACGTLEVGIVSGTPTAGLPPTQNLRPTPSVTPPVPLSPPSRDVDATISALATMNAYLATRVAAQAAPGQNLEPTVSALATMSSYLATRGPARIIPSPDATFTPPPGGTPTTVKGSEAALTPYCRPAEASVDVSASATTLEVGQAVSVTVTLTNGDATDVRLGQVQYTLEVHPSAVLTSDDLGPVDHPLTLEPGQSGETEFVLLAATPGRATLTGSTSFEIHALDYSWGSWSGCRSWPLEIVVTPARDTD